MFQRWYDKDPTLSMAVSLVQNASKVHQELTARYIFRLLEMENLLDAPSLKTGGEERIRFIFPGHEKRKLDVHFRHLLEVLKLLDFEVQQRMSVQMIQYVYVLDAGESEELMQQALLEVDSGRTQMPESG